MEEKREVLQKYLEEHGINVTVTFIGEDGFSCMLSNGEDYYIPYYEMYTI